MLLNSIRCIFLAYDFIFIYGIVVIAWKLDSQLPMQSVHITTNVVSSNPPLIEVYSIQHYVIKFVSDLRQLDCFLLVFWTVSFTNKNNRHDITEILSKVTLSTTNPKPTSMSINKMKRKIKNTTLSEQIQSPIEKS